MTYGMKNPYGIVEACSLMKAFRLFSKAGIHPPNFLARQETKVRLGTRNTKQGPSSSWSQDEL